MLCTFSCAPIGLQTCLPILTSFTVGDSHVVVVLFLIIEALRDLPTTYRAILCFSKDNRTRETRFWDVERVGAV